jgi:hypothetical protein
LTAKSHVVVQGIWYGNRYTFSTQWVVWIGLRTLYSGEILFNASRLGVGGLVGRYYAEREEVISH